MLETKSYIHLRKNELFEALYGRLYNRFGVAKEDTPADIGAWAASLPVILDGKPFTFQRHEYLKLPYEDQHPHQVEMKAAQLGLTSKAIIRAVFGARFKGYRGILYLFPSRSDVTDFSRSRVSPLVDDNPDTIGRWIRDTDSANVKKIWNAFFYFRGMKSRIGLKSIPIDFIIFDELDEAVQTSVDMAMERMAHSEHKIVLKLSNPTLPDYGVHKAFKETDQRYWLLKCSACGAYTCMEETFPDCLLEVNDRVIRACSKCKGELNPSIGEWVAKNPLVTEKRGYHYAQLFSHFTPPADILKQFRTTSNLTDFYNLKLGMPYVEASNRLSVQEVLSLCGSAGIASSDAGASFMGVDQGRDLHVVIGKRHPTKAGEIIFLSVEKSFSELDAFMKRFGVARCVIDSQPETRLARAFAERHKGKVFLCFYNEHQKGKPLWDEGKMIVSVNRTESMDQSHHELLHGNVILPRQSDLMREFATHCSNVAKKLQEDEETGSKRYIYVRLDVDHWRHSFNYECLARSFGASSFFGSSDLR